MCPAVSENKYVLLLDVGSRSLTWMDRINFPNWLRLAVILPSLAHLVSLDCSLWFCVFLFEELIDERSFTRMHIGLFAKLYAAARFYPCTGVFRIPKCP